MSGNPITTDGPKRGRSDADKQRLALIAAGYGLFWLALAISPVNRLDWLLENLLVFAAWAAIAITYRPFPLSTTSYFLIAVFLALHAIGAHYTYSLTPIGDLVRDLLGQDRNHYDRFVHFAFGLLFAYPFSDLLKRYVLPSSRIWRQIFVISLILALSGLYELIEWAAAMILEPEAALAFLGTQGDVFDGQKDAGLAFVGGLIGLTAIAVADARGQRKLALDQ